MRKWWKHSKGSLLKGAFVAACALLFFTAQTPVSRVEASVDVVGTASGAEVPAETPMDAQYATVKVAAAIIRSTASKSSSQVDRLPENSTVIVSGQTAGSDKPWYYITFTGTDGTEKTGYVRSDLINLGEMVPVAEQPEEQQPEEVEPAETQPEPAKRPDYEVVYKADDSGEYAWYLYDSTSGQTFGQKLEDLLNAAHAQSHNAELDAKTVARQRIVIFVLIGVIVLMAVAITIMIFKLRDAYYEAYEDDEDDEDEDEEDEEPSGRRREAGKRTERDREERRREERGREERKRTDEREPARRKSTSHDDRQPAARKRPAESGRMPAREVSYEEDEAPVKAQPKRKAKNFMVDDDFEFEFLNMKDSKKDV